MSDLADHLPETVTVTFDCGHKIEVMRAGMIPGSCAACDMGIPEGATQCDDYPCCGHTDGDGCMPNPRHTSDYWHAVFAGMSPEEMDEYDLIRGEYE